MDRAELLTFEEIAHFVRVAAPLGIDKVRLTGGEPLMRRDLREAGRPDRRHPRASSDVGLTTNGILLAEQAQALYDAGLRRINISLDTLEPGPLPPARPARRPGQRAGRHRRRQAGGLRPDQGQRRQHSRRHRTRGGAAGPLRPRPRPGNALHRVHADRRRCTGSASKVYFAHEILEQLEREFGPLVPAEDYDPRAPAMELRVRRRRRPGRHHRLGVAAVLHELQPRPPDRRRQAAQLPVRPERGGRQAAPARGGRRRRPWPRRSAATWRTSGKGTRSTRRGSSSRCGPCTRSGDSWCLPGAWRVAFSIEVSKAEGLVARN